MTGVSKRVIQGRFGTHLVPLDSSYRDYQRNQTSEKWPLIRFYIRYTKTGLNDAHGPKSEAENNTFLLVQKLNLK